MPSLIKHDYALKRARLASCAEAMQTITNETPKLAGLAYRDRLNVAKRIAFAGVTIAANDEEVDLAAADAAITALLVGMQYKAAGADGPRSLAALLVHRRMLLGLQEPVTLASAKKRVTCDGATLCITSAPEQATLSFAQSSKLTSGPASIFLETGADGAYGVELRLVAGTNPSLTDAEMKKVHFMSPVGLLVVEHEACWFGGDNQAQKGAKLPLQNGRYAVRIYTTGFLTGIKAVLAKSDDANLRPITESLNLQN